MSIQRLHQLVNQWTQQAGIAGHYGSHTLRKTYGYHLRKRGTDLPTLRISIPFRSVIVCDDSCVPTSSCRSNGTSKMARRYFQTMLLW